MEKVVNKLNKERSVFLKISVFVILFFGVNVFLNFSTDTYAVFKNGFNSSAADMVIRNGRPVIGLIYKLHYLSGLSNVSFYYISTFLALIFLTVAVWCYQKILAKHGVGEKTRILLAFVSIANIFIIEYFMFIEKCGFMLAILLEVVSVYFIEKFFEERKAKYFIIILVFMILAIFTYQGTIALFVILSIPFAFKHAKNFIDYVLNGVCIGICYIIPVVIDMLAFKFIFKSARITSEIDLISNLKTVVRGALTNGITTFEILPDYLFLILTFVVFSIGIIFAVMHKNKVLCILNVFVIVLSSIIFPTATILQGSGWWSTRTTYPIASVLGVLAVNLFVNNDLPVEYINTKMIKKVAMLMVGILLIGQYFSFNKIFIDKYKVNALDEYRYNYIGQAIADYQDSTGTEITQIAFYNDATRIYPAYPDLYCKGDLIVSALYPSWSNIAAMNYYLDSNYVKIDPLDEYINYFSSRDWNELSYNQMIFEGDTLHLCVY